MTDHKIYTKKLDDAFQSTNREVDRVYNGVEFRAALLITSLVMLMLVTFFVPDIYPFSMVQYGLFVILILYLDFKHADKLSDKVYRDWQTESNKITNDFYKSLDNELDSLKKGIPYEK